jgi:pSer/pThr/pTyr-binding forkhead associated (FHA) protein
LSEKFPLEGGKPNRLFIMPRVIITVPEKNAQPYRFNLDRKSVSIGRGSDNDIVIDSGSVSGQHAEMRRIEGGYELADVGSTNGIKHRGVRHDNIALVSGISLRLGDVAFDFTLTEEEQELISRERPAAEAPAPVNRVPEQTEEETPKPKRRPTPTPKAEPEPTGVGFGMILLFLLLAAASFATGLSIRHQRDTGESMIKAIVNKEDHVEEVAPSGE